MDVTLKFVPKEDLFPAFGKAFKKDNLIQVRTDLPKFVQAFVILHEYFHLLDERKMWVVRELKANLYAFFFPPIGGLICIFMSLSPTRLKFYVNRFRKNK